MKKLFYIAIASLLALAACKPSEEHYRAAYESAVAKRDSTGGLDGTVYNRFREQARGQALAVGNDTLHVVTEYIGYTEVGGASRENVKRYNIVVGRFKQKFNAQQMQKRLKENGYPETFIIHTREPLYYVVPRTVGTAMEALDALKAVKADTIMVLKEPLPLVLQPAHLAR